MKEYLRRLLDSLTGDSISGMTVRLYGIFLLISITLLVYYVSKYSYSLVNGEKKARLITFDTLVEYSSRDSYKKREHRTLANKVEVSDKKERWLKRDYERLIVEIKNNYNLSKEPNEKLLLQLRELESINEVLYQRKTISEYEYQEAKYLQKDFLLRRSVANDSATIAINQSFNLERDAKTLSDIDNAPAFPWLPPQASATVVLPEGTLKNLNTLHDVDSVLCRALNGCRYNTKAYFSVPSGFAIATQLEQIDESGLPFPSSCRWTQDRIPFWRRNGEFTIASYLKALLLASPGYYRCNVFIVTDKPLSFNTDKEITPKEAASFASRGVSALSDTQAGVRINSKRYKLYALIYEFKRPENSDQAEQTKPSNLQAEDHLKASGLWQILIRQSK